MAPPPHGFPVHSLTSTQDLIRALVDLKQLILIKDHFKFLVYEFVRIMYRPEARGHFEALEATAEGGAVLHEALRVGEAGGAIARV